MGKLEADIDGHAFVDFVVRCRGGRVTIFRPQLESASRADKHNLAGKVCGSGV
jgi:hypothetical protein